LPFAYRKERQKERKKERKKENRVRRKGGKEIYIYDALSISSLPHPSTNLNIAIWMTIIVSLTSISCFLCSIQDCCRNGIQMVFYTPIQEVVELLSMKADRPVTSCLDAPAPVPAPAPSVIAPSRLGSESPEFNVSVIG
jgi:hypothetical protein